VGVHNFFPQFFRQPSIRKQWRFFFYSVHSGGEIDLVLDNGRERIAVEFKASSAPQVSAKFVAALKDVGIGRAWIVAPVNRTYPSSNGITVGAPGDFIHSCAS
jgi:uncharacterized protein